MRVESLRGRMRDSPLLKEGRVSNGQEVVGLGVCRSGHRTLGSRVGGFGWGHGHKPHLTPVPAQQRLLKAKAHSSSFLAKKADQHLQSNA